MRSNAYKFTRTHSFLDIIKQIDLRSTVTTMVAYFNGSLKDASFCL